jgi:molybdopterin converting factor small subunit
MTVRVKLFGPAKDALRLNVGNGANRVNGSNGTGEIIVELSGTQAVTTVERLLAELVSLHPGLGDWKGALRVAVNRKYAAPHHPVTSADEVAIIPPVSGG